MSGEEDVADAAGSTLPARALVAVEHGYAAKQDGDLDVAINELETALEIVETRLAEDDAKGTKADAKTREPRMALLEQQRARLVAELNRLRDDTQ